MNLFKLNSASKNTPPTFNASGLRKSYESPGHTWGLEVVGHKFVFGHKFQSKVRLLMYWSLTKNIGHVKQKKSLTLDSR